MQTLKELQAYWQNTAECTKHIHETFCELVNNDKQFKALRDFVEKHAYGFGERSFYWLWKLIVDDVAKDKLRFLEIGVYKGQIMALIRMLSPNATIEGITPLDTSGGMADRDYMKDIKDLHDKFKLKAPTIHKGLSADEDIVKKMRKKAKYDVVYIDGGHTYDEAKHDIETYGDMVKSGGYLVVDDCACDVSHPFGYFMGIADVCRAVGATLPPKADDNWTFVASVVHIKVWQRN